MTLWDRIRWLVAAEPGPWMAGTPSHARASCRAGLGQRGAQGLCATSTGDDRYCGSGDRFQWRSLRCLTRAGYSPEQVEDLTRRGVHVFLEARHALTLFPQPKPCCTDPLGQIPPGGPFSNGNADDAGEGWISISA